MSVADAGVAAPAEHPPSVFVYSALLDVCAKAGAEEESVRIMRMMKSDKVQPNVVSYSAYLSMFATIGARGDRKAPYKAMQALEEMRAAGLVPNEFSYSSAIASCASATTSIGCSPAVDLGRMLLAAMQRDGIEPDIITYNSLISSFEKGRQSTRAVQTLEQMRRAGVEPDVVSYSSAISACEKSKQSEMALEVFASMKRAGLQPTVITFNALISALEKGGMWSKALDVLEDMKRGGGGVAPDVVSK